MITSLEKRIITISHALKLSHLSAYLTAVNLIDNIYKNMEEGDSFVLSQGHAFCALAVVLEKYKGIDAMKLVKKHMTHPTRCLEDHIDCSTGSLGAGLSVSLGFALANPTKNTYVLISDGECSEGVIFESLAVARKLRLENLRISVNCNSYSAYNKTDVDDLDTRLQAFYPSLCIRTNMFKWPSWIQGIAGHYEHIDTPERLEEMLNA